ncbi:MAG: hypothetical protein H6739_23755 [Alphaproteobacteria bacterium]|nr:hypothetical protein [Alphaproteobacteria bacterium]
MRPSTRLAFLRFSLFVVAAAVGLSACTVTFTSDKEPLFADDTGSPEDEEASDTLNIPACTDFSETSGSHLGYGGYADTASSGTECACTTTLTSNGTPPSYYITDINLRGDGPRPAKVAMETPFTSVAIRTPNPPANGEWEASFNNAPSGAVSLVGDYAIWQATIDFDQNPTDCTEYPSTRVSLDVGPSGPPMTSTDSDGTTESALACEPDAPVVSRFQLVDLPGQTSFVPLYVSGDAGILGLSMHAVRVVDWGDAEALTLDDGEGSVTVVSGDEPVDVDGLWLWSARWTAEELDGALPLVEVTGTCAPVTATRPVVPGYVTSAKELLPWLDADARVVARIVSNGGEGGSAASHHLMFEVEGTGFAQGIPLQSVGADTWAFEIDSETLSMIGQVDLTASALTITVEQGSFGGVGDLSDRQVVLSRYSN